MDRKALSILVIAIVGVIAGAAVVWWARQPPRCADTCPLTGERLGVGGYQVNSPTNVTVTLGNIGTEQITLIAYYINDSYGQQYANTNWPGPTLAPGDTIKVNLLIDGASFTFQDANTYTIAMVASSNTRWTNYFTP